MKTAIVTLESLSTYGQNRYVTAEKIDGGKESADDYEKRTWRERCHANETGNVIIPPMAFKNCLADAASYLSMKIPGQRNATYTKHFKAGVLVMEPLVLPIKKEEVPGQWQFVPSDGRPGGSSRVNKCFPVIQQWSGQVTFLILDELITKDVFLHHLKEAGSFIGIGWFRPQRGGYFGRFKVIDMEWK